MNTVFPRMLRLEQKFPATPPVDIRAKLRQDFSSPELAPLIQPGARLAIAVGSRGIANIGAITAELVSILKARGAQPFIIPAMGSHGGATAEGQTEVLSEYGVTETAMQAPIHASMEVQKIGETEQGTEVFVSTEAMNADGIVVVNRIKPHTDFIGPIGSGVMKMMVIGLGKQTGAASFHAAAVHHGYEKMLRGTVRVILKAAPILCGVGIVENQRHDTALVAAYPKDQILAKEEELFAEAKRLMPKLPFDELDLLIIDRVGKNISGAGMDPNIIGRGLEGFEAMLASNGGKGPRILRIFARDLTPETHGNAIGIGFADFTTSRLARGLDPKSTYVNALTSLTPSSAKVPIHFETDREVLSHAVNSLALSDSRKARVIRIADTLSLERMQVSEAFEKLCSQDKNLVLQGSPEEIQFDTQGNLGPLWS